MATITFDTHKFITRLKAVGMAEKQAEEIVNGLNEIRKAEFQEIVTKQYLDSKLEATNSKLKADILTWLIPMLLGQIAVFGLLVKFIIEL